MTSAPDDRRHSPADRGKEVTATRSLAALERALLADTFREVGQHAPTLSGAWDAYHLVAHLVLREANPVATMKVVLPKVGDAAVDDLVEQSPFAELVERFRSGPPTWSLFRLPGNDRRFNAAEHFIHHEDVRRAQPHWTRRDLPSWAQDQLWRSVRWFAKGITRHSPVGLTLRRTDTGEESVAHKGHDPVVIAGLPSELALHVYGRAAVADVELDGKPESVEQVRRKRFHV